MPMHRKSCDCGFVAIATHWARATGRDGGERAALNMRTVCCIIFCFALTTGAVVYLLYTISNCHRHRERNKLPAESGDNSDKRNEAKIDNT